MNIRLNRAGLLALAVVAAAVSFALPGRAAIAPSDQFTFDIAAFNSSSGTAFILGNDYTATFGTTQTLTSAGSQGQNYTVSSTEVVGATTTTDSFKVSTPTSFINDATIQGVAINGLALTIGDDLSGFNLPGGPNPVNLASPINLPTVTANIVYGTANSVFSYAPTIALASDGSSFTISSAVNNGTSPVYLLAIHEFNVSITYPNPISTVTTITTAAPLHSTYGQSLTIGAATAPASGTAHPGPGSITCLLQPQPTGTPTTTAPVTIDPANGSAQCVIPATQPAGSYTVKATYGGSATGPFGASSSAAAALTIAPAALTITPDAGQSKVYGATDPAFTYTYSGLIGSSTLSGALGRVAGENAGSYAFTLGTVAVSDAGNYAVSLATGRVFQITPESTSVVLGSPCSAVFVGGGSETYTLNATVAPAAAMGSVNFLVRGVTVCSAVPLTAGAASCAVNNLDATNGIIETLPISAVYSGDANSSGNSAAGTLQVIGSAEAILRNGFEVVVPQCPVE